MTAKLPLAAKTKLSFDEFLLFEAGAAEKHEFINGNIKDMAGATTDHNDIAINIYAHLDNYFFENEDQYKVTNSDTMIYIEDYNKGHYPDASVVEGDYEYYNDNKKVITNPLLIFEVLSPSTEEMDEISKFDEYQTLDSSKEYILIHKDKAYVKTYFREEEDLWRIKIIEDLNAEVYFRSIDLKMSMKRIYRKIKFEE
ncbi:MAG: Uma2 family endonuclease [Bacteroidota bacterium]